MVEWKKLGDIAKRNKGIPITAGQMSELASNDGNVRVFAAGSTVADIDENKLPANCAHRLPSIIVKSRGYIDFEFYQKPFTHKNEMWSYSFENKQQGKYIYYFLTTQTDFFIQKAKANSVKLPQLCVADTDNYLIPIPSLEEQTRIVGILDTFTSAIDNLKEQIAQRRKQYEYYRDQLLDLEGKEGVEMKTCGELFEVTDYVANGSFATLRENVSYKQEPDYAILVRTIDLSNNFDGDKVYIDERAYKFLSKSSLFGGEIIINNIGAGVGQTFRCPYLKEKMSLGPNSILVRTPHNDFYYYWFNSIYGQNAIMKVVTPGAMPKFNKTGFKTITVPVPSLSEQSRIVSILDTFEASIANLEAQLKEREKQYEFYRNKLLTFE